MGLRQTSQGGTLGGYSLSGKTFGIQCIFIAAVIGT